MKKVVAPARARYFPALTKVLEKAGSGYISESPVTWADIVITDNLFILSKFVPELFDGYWKIEKFVDRVRQHPNIKDYLSDRPD